MFPRSRDGAKIGRAMLADYMGFIRIYLISHRALLHVVRHFDLRVGGDAVKGRLLHPVCGGLAHAALVFGLLSPATL